MGKGMSKVLTGLYVGCLSDASDIDELEKFKITHILSICNVKTKRSYDPAKITQLHIEAEDTPTQNLSDHFPKAIEFIHKARADGGVVLVHCVAGVSRSVTCTAAYLLSINAHLTWRQAICAIRAARKIANPNLGFQQQLGEWCEVKRAKYIEKVKSWPSVSYEDEGAIQKLLDRHEQWVKTGEDPEGDLYPLEPGAYRTEESEDAVGTSSTTEPQKHVMTRGEKARSAVAEAMRTRLASEKRYDAKTEELNLRSKIKACRSTSTHTTGGSTLSMPSNKESGSYTSLHFDSGSYPTDSKPSSVLHTDDSSTRVKGSGHNAATVNLHQSHSRLSNDSVTDQQGGHRNNVEAGRNGNDLKMPDSKLGEASVAYEYVNNSEALARPKT